ncbi:MAG: DUF2087 domain-containing protein [Eubacteriaceae bacterium]|nr:DUF2087 domain-containing protein [Eubacteriaceae bacterium]
MDAAGIIKNFLDEMGKLKAFPAKRKMKIYCLYYLAEKIFPGKTYTEAEINELLNSWHTFHDAATLRRELYNNCFVDRDPSKGTYKRKDILPDPEEIMKKFG